MMEISTTILIEALGYLGAIMTLGTYSMRRMVSLRAIGICTNVVFIAYGLLAPVYPQLFLHGILLPLNLYRLAEMKRLTRRVANAAHGDLSVEWLKPFMSSHKIKANETIFEKGEESREMYFIVSGRFRLREVNAECAHGELIGEIGLVSPDNRRTLSFDCVEDGELLSISYGEVKELYFQNPQFGFHLLRLISGRLFRDISRYEEALKSRS